jgi:hypothetical protein
MHFDTKNNHKRTYHTDIQLMVKLNLLPENILKDIPSINS